MRKVRTVLVAGAALLGLAGAAVAAERHVMTVDLPSGGVAHIAYEGDAEPVVKIAPAADFAAIPVGRIGRADPFAGFDRLFAEMRARHAALMRRAAALAARAEEGGDAIRIDLASAGGLPAGGYSYTFISTSTGNGTCGRILEVTSRPNAAPQRVSRTFGDCGEAATQAPRPAAPARQAPRPSLPTV